MGETVHFLEHFRHDIIITHVKYVYVINNSVQCLTLTLSGPVREVDHRTETL